jgi:hypothetical protein
MSPFSSFLAANVRFIFVITKYFCDLIQKLIRYEQDDYCTDSIIQVLFWHFSADCKNNCLYPFHKQYQT